MLVTVLEKDTADAVAELSTQGDKAEKPKVEEARTTLQVGTSSRQSRLLGPLPYYCHGDGDD